MRFVYQLGRLSKQFENRFTELEVNFDRKLKEEHYIILEDLSDLKLKINEKHQENLHQDELTSIRTESVLATLSNDIANIVNNIDDIELYLMKMGFRRRVVKLIHGKKRKLTEEDLKTYSEE